MTHTIDPTLHWQIRSLAGQIRTTEENGDVQAAASLAWALADLLDDAGLLAKPSIHVTQYRRNDYVGPPRWGYTGVPDDMEPGDRAHCLWDGHTTPLVCIIRDGRRAFGFADRALPNGNYVFAGFIDGPTR